jgi:hypothetical protein
MAKISSDSEIEMEFQTDCARISKRLVALLDADCLAVSLLALIQRA